MSLKSEIALNYTDANGLVCNRKCLHTDVNPSGNGVCYTSELVVALERLGQIAPIDVEYYWTTIKGCWKEPGLLSRGPCQPDQEGPDDYYGLAAGAAATAQPWLAEAVISYGWAHDWCFDNVTPGRWSWKNFLGRQPQLVCALYAAAGRSPIWLYPLRFYTAAVIATSCMFANKSDADSRRLSWLLIQTMTPVSALCRLAAKLWQHRLMQDYPGQGMRSVAALYYEKEHPYIRYLPTY